MPAQLSHQSTDADVKAAWQLLEAMEQRLESYLIENPGNMARIDGHVYFIADDGRMLAAPEGLNGEPERASARHRTEYEGLSADDMTAIAKAINVWVLNAAGL